jgi:hypothetical protein
MENGEKNQGSYGKRKNKEKSEEEVSDTLGKSVNKSKNVNKMLTKSKSKTTLQRVDKKILNELEMIKEKYNRKSFNDTLQLLLFCYDFLDTVAVRYGLGDIKESTEFIKKYLPKSQSDIIHESVAELIQKTGINGIDADILIDHFLKTLILVKIKKKKASEVLKPLFALRSD